MSGKMTPAPTPGPGSRMSRPSTTMTNDPDAVDQELMMCKICNKELSSPKHFPCLHTFCEPCIMKHAQALREQDSGAQIRCPLCSIPASTSVEADVATIVNKMPVNSLLNGHVVAKQLRTKKCKPCDRNSNASAKKTPATSWCCECNEAMCDACVNTHNSMQLSNNHHVVGIQDAISNPKLTERKLKCVDHPRDDVVKFCMEHQQACCNRCKTSVHSSCSSFLPLDRAVDVMRKKQELPVLVAQLDTMASNTQKIVAERQETLNALDNQKTEQENQIKALREKVNAHLDELERSVREDFDIKHQQEVSQVNQDLEIFAQKGQTVEYYKQLLDSATRNVPPVTVLIEGAKVRQQCQILEEGLQHRAGKIIKPEYELKESDLISAMHSLGSVETRHIPLHSDKPIENIRKQHNSMVKAVVERRSNFLALKYQSSFITGGKMLGRNLLLVDHKGREVRGYSEDGIRKDSHVCQMYGNPWDVAILPPGKRGRQLMVVTIPSNNALQLIESGKRMTVLDRGGHYTTSKKCYGVEYLSGNILVACLDNIEVWEIDEDLRLNFFNLMRTEGTKVKYLCAADSNRLYYSDSDFKGGLYCVTSDGNTIFKYSHKHLRVPMGIAVDERGNVYVTGNHSNNIHQVSPEGALIQIITPDDEGFRKPIILVNDADKLYVSYENHIITHIYPSTATPRDQAASEDRISVPSIPT
ncbi:hypothetical protein FSP39_004715 [Pinctada imbricata]|uniref:Uncharacterized protein n=1 Tax=Pinctada imbricata TaxID=66713 RepID=A0AA89BLT4_PINIB|nr:hypothetical protein FSP39_004715 [Pinctada imbricata]